MGLKCGAGKFMRQAVKGMNVGPLVNYNFLSGSLISAITFTRASSASYYNSTGILTTATTNAARFDYNPTTLALNGLLIEQQSTNALKSSATIGDGNWANQVMTATQNSGTAPDGTGTAVLLTATSVSFPFSQQSTGSSASGNYAVSAYVKQGTNASLMMELSDNTANAAGVLFTFSSKTFTNTAAGNGSVVRSSYQVLPNGWYRIVCVVNFSGAGAANFSYTMGPWNDIAGSATIGNTVLVWGAQSETGLAYATSYIPTTGAAATRAVDTAKALSIPWYNTNAGTIIAQGILFTNLGPSGGDGVFSFNDAGVFNNAIDFRGGSGSAFIKSGGADQGTITPGAWTPLNAVHKTGVSYSAAGTAAATDGGAVVTHGAITVPASISQLWLGDVGFGSSMDGWLQSIKYWNFQLTNSQLQALTA